ncbi:hypothetical protein Y032_0028g1796 [Ancylostoma ceylanicum]|uniref:Uncharacterized protein n=1 Tax=Ancylostoma ceylanicum TaxID=53326 RepID=A0A016UV25_9BILA|nr:hypothetical protein Y032_0028g1796 [Ancylostoma ceylanicum]
MRSPKTYIAEAAKSLEEPQFITTLTVKKQSTVSVLLLAAPHSMFRAQALLSGNYPCITLLCPQLVIPGGFRRLGEVLLDPGRKIRKCSILTTRRFDLEKTFCYTLFLLPLLHLFHTVYIPICSQLFVVV